MIFLDLDSDEVPRPINGRVHLLCLVPGVEAKPGRRVEGHVVEGQKHVALHLERLVLLIERVRLLLGALEGGEDVGCSSIS